jgi:predicted transcriptional regulator
MENTIMTEKIARRGIKTPHSYEPDILEKYTVEQILHQKTPDLCIFGGKSIREARALIKPEMEGNFLIITGKEGEFKGIVSYSNLYSHSHNQKNPVESLSHKEYHYICMKDTLSTAAVVMAHKKLDVLPVVSSEDQSFAGILTYSDVLAIYRHGSEEHEMNQPSISVKKQIRKFILRAQNSL